MWLIYLEYIHFIVLVRPLAVKPEVPIVSSMLLCGNASTTLHNTSLLYPPNMSNFVLQQNEIRLLPVGLEIVYAGERSK